MNWEAISTVTEIIGTIILVVTLVYVLIQIRQNSRQLERSIQATRTSNLQSVSVNFNTWREMVLADDHAGIWVRGLNNYIDLPSTDKMKFNMIAGSFIWTCWLVYQLQRNEGFLVDANNSLFRDLYMHEGYRQWLTLNEKLHSDDFRDFLEEVKENVGDARYEYGEPSSLSAGNY